MPQKQPLVSVVVPNYNYARYLTLRIDSILAQGFTDYELILLDDASTDESMGVMHTYREHPRVSVIERNTQNTGSPFRQWMKGISMARGKYVWIAEADDLAEPDFLERCVHELERVPGAALCYAGSVVIDPQGRCSRKDINHWGQRVRRGVGVFDGTDFARHNLYWKNYTLNASGIVFHREYALKLKDSAFLKMRYCGDWLFWFEMALQGPVIELYRNLNYFRQHPAKVTNASHRGGKGLYEEVEILLRMEEALPALSRYRRSLRRGILQRKVHKLALPKEEEEQLRAYLKATLQSSRRDYYVERSNQLLRWLIPTLLTYRRDRL